MRCKSGEVVSHMLKILLLGVGRWGKHHLRAAASFPVELFVADPRQSELAEAVALGISASHLSTDYREFVARADAVVVATPAQTHFELTRSMLAAGKDVFVEKPLALHASEASELARLAEARERILQVGHIFRFEAGARWLREEILSGRFGMIKLVRANFSGFKRPRNDTGVLFADGIHFVDLVNYLLGRPPLQVFARLKDFLGRGMDDQCFLTLDYPPLAAEHPGGECPGVLATLEAGYHIPGKIREVMVLGTEMSATCDFTKRDDQIVCVNNRHLRNREGFEALDGKLAKVATYESEPLVAEWRAFLDSVLTRKHPLVDGWEGYDAVRVVESAMKSARDGVAVNLGA